MHTPFDHWGFPVLVFTLVVCFILLVVHFTFICNFIYWRNYPAAKTVSFIVLYTFAFSIACVKNHLVQPLLKIFHLRTRHCLKKVHPKRWRRLATQIWLRTILTNFCPWTMKLQWPSGLEASNWAKYHQICRKTGICFLTAADTRISRPLKHYFLRSNKDKG